MHELHLVGFTADHDGLILSTQKGATSGAYVVGIDDALFAALEQARRMAMAEPDDARARAVAERVRALRPTQRSTLAVRDIQSRLRSGMTLAQVAAEAGVDEQWVGRFAAPVLAEQAAIVERAVGLSLGTARKGTSSRPLGEAVRWNLDDRGISVDTRPQAAGWSAFQLEPGQWAVRFAYTSRGRQQVAEWEVDLEADELSARNRSASDLGFVESGARRRKAPEVATPTLSTPAPKKATSGRKGTPARTKTARAQAAKATSSKAAVVRSKAAKATPPTRPAPARAGANATPGRRGSAAPAPAADPRRGSGPKGPPASSGTVKRAAAGGAGAAPPAPPERPAAKETARFPAPRPAAGRAERTSSAPVPPNRRPAPPAARQPPPHQPAPSPRPPPPPPAAVGPTLRRVAPPEPRRTAEPTADARPMPTTLRAEPPAEAGPEEQRSPPGTASGRGPGPDPDRTPTVRRLPAPSPTAAARKADGPPVEAVFAQQPDIPTPDPEPTPIQPLPAPASVRPVGGGDGRPTILIIDADRAGDRRRS